MNEENKKVDDLGFPENATYFGKEIAPVSSTNIIVSDKNLLFEYGDRRRYNYDYWRNFARRGFDKEKEGYDDWALAYRFRYEQAAMDAGVERFCKGLERGSSMYLMKVPKSLVKILRELEEAEYMIKKIQCCVVDVPYRLEYEDGDYCFDYVMCKIVENLTRNISGFDIKKQTITYDYFYDLYWPEDNVSLVYPLIYSCETVEEMIELSGTIRETDGVYIGSVNGGRKKIAFSKTETESAKNLEEGFNFDYCNHLYWLKRLQ